MNTIYWLWLALKKKISPSKALKLIFHFKNVKAVYGADEEDYKKLRFLTPADIKLLSDKSLKRAEDEIKMADKLDVAFVTYDSGYYPEELRFISNPPLLFYAAGDLSVLQNEGRFCIVGTRNATAYGINTAMQISGSLASSGIVIVSGMAVGIDTAAHRGALKAGGKTIAILGCGIDVDYPADSGELKRQICKNGVILSEFPFKTIAYPKNFPYRNRVLSGMSLGVAAVEGDMRSGSLITAKYGLDQGKDVYSVPGNITSHYSMGTNELIRDGAQIILSVNDILEDFVLKYPHLFNIKETNAYRKIKSSKEQLPKATALAAETSREYIAKTEEKGITEEEKAVLAVLSDKPVNIDEIAMRCGLSIVQLNGCMVKLQVKKMITEHPGRNYTLN